MGYDVPDSEVEHPVQQGGRLLKGAVAGLCAVVALCAIVITVAIVYLVIEPLPPPARAPVPFGVSALPVPVGCLIDYVLAEDNRLTPEIGGSDECRRILVTDLATGNLLGRYQFPGP
jgi:hypothetical protein